MREKKYHYSLLNRFISLIFLVFLSLVICVGWKIETVRRNFSLDNLAYVERSINQNISSNFRYTEDKLRFIGMLIADQELTDHKQIFHLLQLFSSDPKIQLMPWRSVGWADSNHIARLTSKLILKTPVDLRHRPYLKDISSKAFTLCFGNSDNSYTDNLIGCKA